MPENAQVYVASDILGDSFIKKIDCERDNMLAVFKKITANRVLLQGDDAETMAKNSEIGVDKLTVLFALKVFEELGLIKIEDGKLTIYKGVKTELTASPLYNLINGKLQ